MSATAISSEDVSKLRAKTGAGLMDCKRALQSSAGDFEKAVKILREQGQASAAKRAGRTTGDGLVTVHDAGKVVVMAELNCETDFVAKTDVFQNLLKDLAKEAAGAGWADAAAAPKERVVEIAAKLGENITFRRFARFEQTKPGVVGIYVHPLPPLVGMGKVAVLVELLTTAAGDDVKALAKDLSMQIAAAAPKFVRREDAPAATLESEKEIARTLAQKEGKPEKIWDKIAEGKLNQYFSQYCLLDQPYVKEPSGKTPVKVLIEQVAKKVGAPIEVARFARFKVGEEE